MEKGGCSVFEFHFKNIIKKAVDKVNQLDFLNFIMQRTRMLNKFREWVDAQDLGN